MNIRRNLGIILMMFGVLMTIDQNNNHQVLIKQVEQMIKAYWPLVISFFGIYMISYPRKRRK